MKSTKLAVGDGVIWVPLMPTDDPSALMMLMVGDVVGVTGDTVDVHEWGSFETSCCCVLLCGELAEASYMFHTVIHDERGM